MHILAPSILSANLSNLEKQIRLVEMSGADWIHCDIMDGHFVPNISFGPILVKAVNEITKLPLDVHLMIENADDYIESFVQAGADHILVHYEAVVHLNRTINFIKQFGVKAGVVLNPSTPVNSVIDIAEYIDLLLIMSVNPGFGGQNFINNSLRKIQDAVEIRNKLNANFLIEVDGGVDKNNISQILLAGCDAFVIGSSIFNTPNIAASTVEFKNIINY